MNLTIEQAKKFFGESFANAIIGHESSDPEIKDQAAKMVKFFDKAVDTLRNPETFPNKHINELVTLLWRLVGNRMVPMCGGPVPTLSFTALGNPTGLVAAVVSPQNWPDMFEEDPMYQMGAIVFVASQCRDFYNSKLNANPKTLADKSVVRRAKCYEAEFLLTILGIDSTYQFNSYQKHVLEVAPQGVKSLGDLEYESQPFVRGPVSPLWLMAQQNTQSND